MGFLLAATAAHKESAPIGGCSIYRGPGVLPDPIVLPDPFIYYSPLRGSIFVSRGSGEHKSPEKPTGLRKDFLLQPGTSAAAWTYMMDGGNMLARYRAPTNFGTP